MPRVHAPLKHLRGFSFGERFFVLSVDSTAVLAAFPVVLGVHGSSPCQSRIATLDTSSTNETHCRVQHKEPSIVRARTGKAELEIPETGR